MKRQDCNACANTGCKGAVGCSSWKPIRGTFPLIELALEHPQGLIDTELSLRNFRSGITLRIANYLK